MMDSSITISQLARLMGVSVHQIRYFEEKGVLHPAYIGDNQYRMYRIDQVYQLAQVLLLRQIGLSVSEIADSWTNEDASVAERTLDRSLRELDEQILELQQRKRLVEKIRQEWRLRASDGEQITVQKRERIALTRFTQISSEGKLNARQLLDHARLVPDLFEKDIYYIEDGMDNLILYVEGQEPAERVLPEGQCLVHLFTAADVQEIADHIEQMRGYAKRRRLHLTEPPVVIEKSYLSLFGGDSLHYECLFYLDTTTDHQEGD